MALTDSYVDPSIAGNSGAGTIGDPWGDIQYGLDQVTRDGTNGDRFNILTGTDEILAAALSLATYGTPTAAARLQFQGYTAAAEDGGIGGISGNGSLTMMAAAGLDFISFVDMHLHNSGSATILALDNNITLENCEIDNTSGRGVNVDVAARVVNCYFHNIGNTGLETQSCFAYGNYFANGTNQFTTTILVTAGEVVGNVLNLSGSANASNGIAYGDNSWIVGNSIWCAAGTGHGILPAAAAELSITILNNIVEGFSGVSGVGIELSADDLITIYGFNACFNNATNFAVSASIMTDLGNNDVLVASPFTDPASDDFTVGTEVRATAFPLTFKGASTDNALDQGAAQRVEPAGSGGGLRLAGHGGLAA